MSGLSVFEKKRKLHRIYLPCFATSLIAKLWFTGFPPTKREYEKQKKMMKQKILQNVKNVDY